MKFIITKEEITHRKEVEALIEKAFAPEPMSDHQEHALVNKLRRAPEFLADLSLVAIGTNTEILGHIIFTPILIKKDAREFRSLALAPVSVLPGHQGEGIGSALIKGRA